MRASIGWALTKDRPLLEGVMAKDDRLFIVNPDNYLYEIGARSGDVIKRINGHPIDSTEKLYKIWSGLPQESRVVLDLDRGGKTVTYDYTFTE